MNMIPIDERDALISRIKTLINAEEVRDVEMWFSHIDPVVMEQRILNMDDEPGQTKSSIAAFMKTYDSVKLLDIEVETYNPDGGSSYRNCPVAYIKTKVAYNIDSISVFSGPWILYNGLWYCRSVGKFWLNKPPNP